MSFNLGGQYSHELIQSSVFVLRLDYQPDHQRSARRYRQVDNVDVYRTID